MRIEALHGIDPRQRRAFLDARQAFHEVERIEAENFLAEPSPLPPSNRAALALDIDHEQRLRRTRQAVTGTARRHQNAGLDVRKLALSRTPPIINAPHEQAWNKTAAQAQRRLRRT